MSNNTLLVLRELLYQAIKHFNTCFKISYCNTSLLNIANHFNFLSVHFLCKNMGKQFNSTVPNCRSICGFLYELILNYQRFTNRYIIVKTGFLLWMLTQKIYHESGLWKLSIISLLFIEIPDIATLNYSTSNVSYSVRRRFNKWFLLKTRSSLHMEVIIEPFPVKHHK